MTRKLDGNPHGTPGSPARIAVLLHLANAAHQCGTQADIAAGT